jgi:hypothetical protein
MLFKIENISIIELKKKYEVIGFALHSETYEEMVIYKALYHCPQFGNNRIWVRPKAIFLQQVDYNGLSLPRFKLISE